MLPRGDESRPKRFEMTVADLLHGPTVHGLVLNYRDITERALHQEQLTQQAFHDPHTDLPNRARFQERLEFALQALSRRGTAAASRPRRASLIQTDHRPAA